MGLKFDTKKAMETYLRNYSKVIEKALIYQLEVLVAELERHAKESGQYQDRTGNLRSSIGGVVVKNGVAVKYIGFDEAGGETEQGTQTGLEFINSKLEEVGTGYGIIVVAGMEYAAYVEDVHNLNVLKATELKANSELPKVLNLLQSL